MEIKDEFLEFMYTHDWTGRYNQLTFVPYKSNEIFTPSMQAAMVESHNKYLISITRKIIKVSNARVEYETNEGNITFQDWLASSKVGGDSVITGVEVAPDNIVRIIYKKEDMHVMASVFAELYDNVVQSFGKGVAEILLDSTKYKNTKNAHTRELTYAKKIIQKCNINPQAPPESIPPPQRKAQIVFGSYANAAASTTNTDAHVLSQSGTSVVTEESREMTTLKGQLHQLQQSHKELQEQISQPTNATGGDKSEKMQQRINELVESQQKLEDKMTTTLSSEVKKTLELEIKPFHEDLKKKYEQKQQGYEDRFKEITDLVAEQNKKYDNRFHELQTSMNQTMTASLQNALAAYFENKTPSGTPESSRGASK